MLTLGEVESNGVCPGRADHRRLPRSRLTTWRLEPRSLRGEGGGPADDAVACAELGERPTLCLRGAAEDGRRTDCAEPQREDGGRSAVDRRWRARGWRPASPVRRRRSAG